MRKIGYGRTSSLEQVAGLEAQKRDLANAGCDPEHIYVEQLSSVATTRPKLEEAIAAAQAGDEFVVAKLDRLCRSVADLVDIDKRLAAKGASIIVLDPPLENKTVTGRLMFSVFGAVAQFEREMMLQRQREGIAKAKAEKRYKGRKPTAREKSNEVLDLRKRGLSPTEIVKLVGISPASVYRIFNDADEAKAVA